ncbi:phospholipid scramblase 3 isoform X3 [Podarcis raffonei]|uniref:phospholipid scramblase 3 isoform X3 n=1 Tax=Podarcis raffonei TaxID=65483 RepID=UPI0023296EF7|nr:phospholipid scramblase 3 isoform X3 [Podarcis raffonei]
MCLLLRQEEWAPFLESRTQGHEVRTSKWKAVAAADQKDAGSGVVVHPTSLTKRIQKWRLQVDQILIHQKVELVEAFIGFEGNNKYEVRNSLGQHIFHAQEQNDCCTRNCCGSLRRFSMRLDDPAGREVLRMVRPLKCVSCWFPCCLQELEVQCPPGTTIGYVVQTWHPFNPKFSIQNVEKETVLRVLGPCFACSCGGDVNFEVKTRDESRGVGRISKQWSGLLKEVFTDTDNFGIQFPMDLDVKIKAVLLGACFLIDFMFFEKTGEVGQRSSVITS